MNQRYEITKNCNKELARCYIPIQEMNIVYDSRKALQKGTLFPELYRPYTISEKVERRGKYYG